jgi:MFS family permease
VIKKKHSKWTALFISNFLGVYNDNLLKNAVIFISVTWSAPAWLDQSQLVALVSGSLVLPYIFLSPYGGMLSIRYAKIKIFRFFKLMEFPIMFVAIISFYFQWIWLAVFSVLLMGSQSALYSPSKYSLIRDIGGEEGVSFGSGVFEMMAFLGILIGTVTASVISDFYQLWVLSAFFLFIAGLGYLTTIRIKAKELPPDKEMRISLNPAKFILHSYRFAHVTGYVNSAVFGASAFWLLGSILQMNLVIHTKNVYHASNTVTGTIMAITAIGIATGCWSAGKLQGKGVNPGLILTGLAGMMLTLLMLAFLEPPIILYGVIVFITAFMGGIFQVPNLSMLQNSNLGRKLGDMIAYLNLITFVFILGGSVLFSASMALFNNNSFIVFGVIFTICLMVAFYYIRKDKMFLHEMLKIIGGRVN